MTDIPKVPTVQLKDALAKTLSASQAVKAHVATHAQKHTARLHAARAKQESERQLRQQGTK